MYCNQPFEEGMESAFRRGTLVLFQNLDPSFTSSEVEVLILFRCFIFSGSEKTIDAFKSRTQGP